MIVGRPGDCGEGDCEEGDCGDCGDCDCWEGDCGEGELIDTVCLLLIILGFIKFYNTIICYCS